MWKLYWEGPKRRPERISLSKRHRSALECPPDARTTGPPSRSTVPQTDVGIIVVSFEQGCSLDQQQPTPSALLGRECLGESAAIVQAPAE